MRPVKDTNVFKQDNGNATSLSFRDFGAKLCEQSLDVAPLNVPACGPSKDQFEGALVLSLHAGMVPLSSTDVTQGFLKAAIV